MDFVPAFSGLLAFRLGLTSISSWVTEHHLLASPLSSLKRLQEGLYLYKHDIDPYAGGPCYHSPLYVALFSTVLPSSPLLWLLADAVGAYALVCIWRARQGRDATERDALLAALYLLNPYLILPSLARSTATLENALTLLSLMFASTNMPSPALLTLSLITHLSLDRILLLPALLMLILVGDASSHLANPQPFGARVARKDALPRLKKLLASFAAYSAVLSTACTLVAGNTNWIGRVWGAPLTLPDLTPNSGLWWYFFTEMFDHFRPFFLVVFNVHLAIYVAPLCLKFQHDPLYAAALSLGVLGTFRAYPTLADPGLFFSILGVFPEVYKWMYHPIVTTLLHLHAALLLPLFHHLWLVQGTGNANFFYASTLVFGAANGAALTDAVWAGLRIAIGEVGEGRAVIQE